MNDPVVALMFLFFGLALVGVAIASGMSPPPARRRVRYRVVNLPVGSYRKVRDSFGLPALPWPRSWFCTSRWPEGWWVVVTSEGGFAGPQTPKKFGDRWDQRQQRFVPT